MPILLKQLNLILTRKQKKGITELFFGALAVALIDTFSVALMSPFMTILLNLDGFHGSSVEKIMSYLFKSSDAEEALLILSVFFVLLYLFRGILKITYNYFQAKLMADYRIELSTRLFRHVMNKPYSYHTHHNTAETQRLVSTDVNHCFTLILQLLLMMSSILVSIGVFSVLLLLDWKLTIVIVVVLLTFVLFIQRILKRKIFQLSLNFREANTHMFQWVTQSIGSIKNTLIKRRQEYYVYQYQNAARECAVAECRFSALDQTPKVLIDTLCMVMIFGVVFVEILVGTDVAKTLPVFATFAVAATRLIPVVSQMASTINSVSYYKQAVNTISETLEQETDESIIQNHMEAAKDPIVKREIEKEIEVSNLSFRFDDSEDYLFQNLTLKIPVKKSVAFVGATGAGKTTLADIILGLQKPIQGEILADGINIHDNLEWWSKIVGYIPQQIYLCDDTIRANVAFGINAEEIDDEWVWECLKRARIKEFVESLPQKLDTITGENGVRLSGGQRQRIGIARALYSKPQFLVMDEATSALDVSTEKAIVESINELSGELTLLIIAHRLSTIKDCDIIYRIEEGTVVIERRK